tara:strand:- start:134 stop:439 length:306 start_codon:yes stop_codon:yes gene_type:complete
VEVTIVPLIPTATKTLFPNATEKRVFEVELSVVALSQVEPLSVDLIMFPALPTATKVLFAKVLPLIHPSYPDSQHNGEVTLSQVVALSVDLIMVPTAPTAT